MNANTNSNVSATIFPADGSARQKLGHAVKTVLMHERTDEWHPWQFRVRDKHVELSAYADVLARDDSEERELMIRCGRALFQLKLALKHFGCLGRVELFPNLAQAELVAKVYFGCGRYSDVHEAGQFEALVQGGNQAGFGRETPLQDSALETLHGISLTEKAWLDIAQCESSRSRLAVLAHSGARALDVQHRVQTRPQHSRVAQWTRPLLTFIVRPSDQRAFPEERGGRKADDMAALATIKTKTDDKQGWLATGQIIARTSLLAKSLGIPAQVFDQAFRPRRVREELRTTIGHKGFVQAIVGFGTNLARVTDGGAGRQTDMDGFRAGEGNGVRPWERV